MLAGRAWTGVQRRWLERIADLLKEETVVDRQALDELGGAIWPERA